MKDWRVGRSDDRLLLVHSETDHGLRPGAGIVRQTTVKPQVLPEDGPRLLREFPRERMFDFHEAVADELLHLRFGQCLRRLRAVDLVRNSHGVNPGWLATRLSQPNIRALILM